MQRDDLLVHERGALERGDVAAAFQAIAGDVITMDPVCRSLMCGATALAGFHMPVR